MQNQLRLLQRRVAATNALGFEFIAAFPQARGVDEHHRETADVGGFLDRVAGGARNRRDNRPLVTEQVVQQTRLAGVWPTNDRRANASSQDLPFVGSAQQPVDKRHRVGHALEQLLQSVGRDVFVREIKVRLDMRERGDEAITKLIDLLRQLAGELFVGRRQGEIGPGVNEIRHRFGLREIQPAAQERPLRELARLGEARAAREHRIEHTLGSKQAAVAGDLHDVLAGKRAWRAHHGDQHLVDDALTPESMAILDRVRGRGTGTER